MSWWIVPFFIASLMAHSIVTNLRSYLTFLVALVVFTFAGLLLGFFDARLYLWNRSGHWKRYLILVVVYAATIMCVTALTVAMDYYGLINYFGGDAAGSFGMYYIPSVAFYLVAGGIFCAVFSAFKRLRRKN